MVKLSALLVLVTGTCWAVASLVSVWLVPPYLVALGWILFPTPGSIPRPGGGRRDHADITDSLTLDPARDQAGGAGIDGSPTTTASSPELAADGADPDLAPDSPPRTATAAAKPKRARSRTRKAKPTTEPVEVAPATWVEVGPGKFVRAETPSATVNATAHGPHIAVEPEPAVVAEAEPTDGSATPDLALFPDRNRDLSPPDSRAGLTLAGADAVVGPPTEAEAPAEVPVGSLVDRLADSLDARPVPEALDLINPTADGIAPQVGVDAEPDPRHARPAEVDATTLDRAPVLDPSAWDSPAAWVDSTAGSAPDESMILANEAVVEFADSCLEAEREWRETASGELLEADYESGSTSEEASEVASAALDVSGPQGFAPLRVSRRSRVRSSRLTDRRAPRGFRRREARLAGGSTPTRRLVRRVAGRSRQIARTAKPRSPPAPFGAF